MPFEKVIKPIRRSEITKSSPVCILGNHVKVGKIGKKAITFFFFVKAIKRVYLTLYLSYFWEAQVIKNETPHSLKCFTIPGVLTSIAPFNMWCAARAMYPESKDYDQSCYNEVGNISSVELS